MEKKINFSKNPFEGYINRFVVRFITDKPYTDVIDIYSDTDKPSDLVEFIDKNKSKKVISFSIEHCSTKQQDDLQKKFIDEFLSGEELR